MTQQQIRSAIDAAKSEYYKELKKLHAKMKRAADDMQSAIDAAQSQCRHKWGEWMYAYEMPRMRDCKICGKEEIG